MAADTGVWHHNTVPYHIKKIMRVNGSLVAATGRTGLVTKFYQWVAEGMNGEFDRSEAGDGGFHGIIVGPDGRVLQVEIMGPALSYNAPFYVMGAPHEIMLGAMAAGATAQQAVEIAIRWTDGAAGGIQVEKLHETDGLFGHILGNPAEAA